jgi:protein-arginine kinase activator protein McsA
VIAASNMMMVRISKDGVFFEIVEIDEDGKETRKTVDVLATSLGIVSYLTFPVSVDEGVTVEDIMNILVLHNESTDFIFDSSLGGHSFNKFWDEMQKDIPQDPTLSWMEIAHESDPLTDEELELYSTPRMRGIGKNRELFSVEFSSVASYKKMEVKLNTNYVISKMNSAEEEIIVLSCTKSFTLFDLIHSLLYEMSYYGDPTSREEVLSEVMESLGVDKIEAFKLSDKSNIYSLKDQLQAAIEKEDYEEAAKIRDKMNKLLNGKNDEDED